MLGCKNPICKNPGKLVTKAPLTFAWQGHWCHLKHLHSHRWHWQWGHDPSHLSGLWKWAIQSIRGRIAESWKEHKGTDDCRISRKGRISKNMQRSYWIFVYWMPILLYFSHHAQIAAPNGFLHVLQVPDRQTPHVVASGQMSILPATDQPWSAIISPTISPAAADLNGGGSKGSTFEAFRLLSLGLGSNLDSPTLGQEEPYRNMGLSWNGIPHFMIYHQLFHFSQLCLWL